MSLWAQFWLAFNVMVFVVGVANVSAATWDRTRSAQGIIGMIGVFAGAWGIVRVLL